MKTQIGPYFDGIDVNNPADYDKLTDRIEKYDELIGAAQSEVEKEALRMEQGDLSDAAKRMTCNIGM